jgi:hypothetical protein
VPTRRQPAMPAVDIGLVATLSFAAANDGKL